MPRPPPAKKGIQNQALGRSRGGLTSKWHLAVDSLGRPIRFLLTGGQANDAANALPLIAGFTAAHLIADRAYDSHAILDHAENIGARPIIPQRSCMTRQRDFDPGIYKHRNRIERTIGKLKQLRRIATRYDRLPANYLACLYLASLSFWC
jgi:transposase